MICLGHARAPQVLRAISKWLVAAAAPDDAAIERAWLTLPAEKNLG
jgi:hypothetical protein